MFEQRVLTAYREKVALEKQRKLIEEEEERERAERLRKETRHRKKEMKKQRRKQNQEKVKEEQEKITQNQPKVEPKIEIKVEQKLENKSETKVEPQKSPATVNRHDHTKPQTAKKEEKKPETTVVNPQEDPKSKAQQPKSNASTTNKKPEVPAKTKKVGDSPVPTPESPKPVPQPTKEQKKAPNNNQKPKQEVQPPSPSPVQTADSSLDSNKSKTNNKPNEVAKSKKEQANQPKSDPKLSTEKLKADVVTKQPPPKNDKVDNKVPTPTPSAKASEKRVLTLENDQSTKKEKSVPAVPLKIEVTDEDVEKSPTSELKTEVKSPAVDTKLQTTPVDIKTSNSIETKTPVDVKTVPPLKNDPVPDNLIEDPADGEADAKGKKKKRRKKKNKTKQQETYIPGLTPVDAVPKSDKPSTPNAQPPLTPKSLLPTPKESLPEVPKLTKSSSTLSTETSKLPHKSEFPALSPSISMELKNDKSKTNTPGTISPPNPQNSNSQGARNPPFVPPPPSVLNHSREQYRFVGGGRAPMPSNVHPHFSRSQHSPGGPPMHSPRFVPSGHHQYVLSPHMNAPLHYNSPNSKPPTPSNGYSSPLNEEFDAKNSKEEESKEENANEGGRGVPTLKNIISDQFPDIAKGTKPIPEFKPGSSSPAPSTSTQPNTNNPVNRRLFSMSDPSPSLSPRALEDSLWNYGTNGQPASRSVVGKHFVPLYPSTSVSGLSDDSFSSGREQFISHEDPIVKRHPRGSSSLSDRRMKLAFEVVRQKIVQQVLQVPISFEEWKQQMLNSDSTLRLDDEFIEKILIEADRNHFIMVELGVVRGVTEKNMPCFHCSLKVVDILLEPCYHVICTSCFKTQPIGCNSDNRLCPYCNKKVESTKSLISKNPSYEIKTKNHVPEPLNNSFPPKMISSPIPTANRNNRSPTYNMDKGWNPLQNQDIHSAIVNAVSNYMQQLQSLSPETQMDQSSPPGMMENTGLEYAPPLNNPPNHFGFGLGEGIGVGGINATQDTNPLNPIGPNVPSPSFWGGNSFFSEVLSINSAEMKKKTMYQSVL
eukprot:TRINITY_DN6674_c0_g1_i1.p1 TRINITY_DN6674_c0_g1~~TRINITY_DN6674_c0_g1_i1.p1  ORF type:complete len:1105 (+),score=323.85 TRINITY_DN6674_c0_g1_i1:186-3317(+)